MLKWTLIAGGGLVALVVLAAIAGWFLPQDHHASRTAVLGAAPERVFEVLVDVARYPEWRTGVTKVELLADEGHGVRFREHGSNGPIVFRVEHADVPRLLRVRIDDPGQPFGGTWTHELAPDDTGTRLTITEDGEVYNPLFRFMSRFVFSQTATMEQFIKDLEQALG
jgi:uncharacterized protein YndB with AHSA1/START domain